MGKKCKQWTAASNATPPLPRPLSSLVHLPPAFIPPQYISIFCKACTDKQETNKTKFARIEAKEVTISKAVFNKSTSDELFVNNCTLNIVKATIKFPLTVDGKERKQLIQIKDIEICTEEAKINPQSLFLAAKKCTIASPNWALRSDKTRVIAEKIVIKPIVF